MVEGREMRGRECRGERMLKDSIKDKCLWRSAASCISSRFFVFLQIFLHFFKIILPPAFLFFLSLSFLFSFCFELFFGGGKALCVETIWSFRKKAVLSSARRVAL